MVQSLPQSDGFRILFNSPELSEVQRSSFHLFLKKGIAEELSKISCIQVKNVHFLIEIVIDAENFRLVTPENNYRDCTLKMKSYTCKLYVKTKIIFKDKVSGELLYQTKPEWVLLADLPIMTKRGHFVINGSPRVIVHQVGRSPGIYFKKVVTLKKDITNTARFYGDIIPRKGVWVRLQINKKGEIDLKLKKSKKVRAEMVQKCLELLEKEKSFLPFQNNFFKEQRCTTEMFNRSAVNESTTERVHQNKILFQRGTNAIQLLKKLSKKRSQGDSQIHRPVTRNTKPLSVQAQSNSSLNSPTLLEVGFNFQDCFWSKTQQTQTFARVENTVRLNHFLVQKKQVSKSYSASRLSQKIAQFGETAKENLRLKAEKEAFVNVYTSFYKNEIEDTDNRISRFVVKSPRNFAKFSSYKALAKRSFAYAKASVAGAKQATSFVHHTDTGLQVQLNDTCNASTKASLELLQQKPLQQSNDIGSSVITYNTALRGGVHEAFVGAELRCAHLRCAPKKCTKATSLRALPLLSNALVKPKYQIYQDTSSKKTKVSKKVIKRQNFSGNLERIHEYLYQLFKRSELYDLSLVGREKINTKFGISVIGTQLTALDIKEGIHWLSNLKSGKKEVDDIDHSENRRVRTSSELIQTQFEIGLTRLKSMIIKKVRNYKNEELQAYIGRDEGLSSRNGSYPVLKTSTFQEGSREPFSTQKVLLNTFSRVKSKVLDLEPMFLISASGLVIARNEYSRIYGVVGFSGRSVLKLNSYLPIIFVRSKLGLQITPNRTVAKFRFATALLKVRYLATANLLHSQNVYKSQAIQKLGFYNACIAKLMHTFGVRAKLCNAHNIFGKQIWFQRLHSRSESSCFIKNQRTIDKLIFSVKGRVTFSSINPYFLLEQTLYRSKQSSMRLLCLHTLYTKGLSERSSDCKSFALHQGCAKAKLLQRQGVYATHTLQSFAKLRFALALGSDAHLRCARKSSAFAITRPQPSHNYLLALLAHQRCAWSGIKKMYKYVCKQDSTSFLYFLGNSAKKSSQYELYKKYLLTQTIKQNLLCFGVEKTDFSILHCRSEAPTARSRAAMLYRNVQKCFGSTPKVCTSELRSDKDAKFRQERQPSIQQNKSVHLGTVQWYNRGLAIKDLSVSELFSTKPVNGALREFFSSSPLSQYMDQTNPLAEITHKRRISSLGVGGVSRESAGMTIRGIHPTHYGRICPIETPEGKNAGLVNSLAFYAKINSKGFIETPYYQVMKGQIQHELGFSFYSARKESRKGLYIAPNDIQQSKSKLLGSNISSIESIPVRVSDNLLDLFKKVNPYQVDCIGISPAQILSIATSLIPFLEHNDANRALMGSNMQRQAVPLMISERPIVGTGLEARVLAESGHLVQSKVSGFVSHVSTHKVIVEHLNSIPTSSPKQSFWSHVHSLASQKRSFCTARLRFAQPSFVENRRCAELRLQNFAFAPPETGTTFCKSRAFAKQVQNCLATSSVLPRCSQDLCKSGAELRFCKEQSSDCKALLLHQKVLHVQKGVAKICFVRRRSSFIEKGLLARKVVASTNLFRLRPSLKVNKSLYLLSIDSLLHNSITHVYLNRKSRKKGTRWSSCTLFRTCSCKGAQVTCTQGTCTKVCKYQLYGSELFLQSQYKARLLPVTHSIMTFTRSNQETGLVQKPLIEEGDWVQKGDMLSDCSAGQKGELSVGKNMFIAYIPWQGYNFEDAIVISQRLVKEQLYTSLHIERYTVLVNDFKDKVVDTNEWFTANLPGVEPTKIAHLQKSGLPKIGAILKEGDILVGKIKYSKKKPSTPHEKLVCDILGEQNFSVQNSSLYVPKGVHEARVLTYKIKKRFEKPLKNNLRPAGAPKIVHIFLGEKRHIQIGDKMSGRHGNKGIVSTILPKQDMPYLADGKSIDILLNPLGVPSRMNVGQVFECLLGLASTYLHQNCKVTAFDELYGSDASQSLVFLKLYQARLQSGQNWLFQINFPGKTRLTDGRSGECFDQWITVGRAYMLKLIHMVNEKIHARAIGPYALVTQQPLKGRAHKGGQRLGEMEVWAVEGFGAAYILQELLTKKSDDSIGRKEILKAMLPKAFSFLDLIEESSYKSLASGTYGVSYKASLFNARGASSEDLIETLDREVTQTEPSLQEVNTNVGHSIPLQGPSPPKHNQNQVSVYLNSIKEKEENKLVLGQPDIFKVLICELQALCLDVGVYSMKTESFQRKFLGFFE